ncbi:LOW QUALITY PROTEIN: squalene synthase-like [Octopus sinensis]|uniref:LOW QUALITY PROTEIN: squalene synthase-like n=1 Tax=Octopus sinensis TaxID=2607531 RepID=A0A7E6EKJ9_9MOLL|nr:LOW QUALITY PROTEIN: squalene synthase-like [Octopus sinensis]
MVSLSKLLECLFHPQDLFYMAKFRLGGSPLTPSFKGNISGDQKICFDLLAKTSRSFGGVIQSLNKELSLPVAIFYLVLRALDTIEDDTSIDLELRKVMLKEFPTRLSDPSFVYPQSNGSEILQMFPMLNLKFHVQISREYLLLDDSYRRVIVRVCEQMARGMCEYMDRGVNTLAEWDEYCYYVAGLVGMGLSALFVGVSGEDDRLNQKQLWNSMGLFLQKTNIIRDYAEDLSENRAFWPKEVMIYIFFRFGANMTPKYSYFVMAMATLERCFNNPDVLRRNVKIRRGETVAIIMGARDYDSARALLYKYIRSVRLMGGIPSLQVK